MDQLPQDPMMLFSFINMKLRDEFASLEELCAALDVPEEEITSRLGAVGFEYNAELNKFW